MKDKSNKGDDESSYEDELYSLIFSSLLKDGAKVKDALSLLLSLIICIAQNANMSEEGFQDILNDTNEMFRKQKGWKRF